MLQTMSLLSFFRALATLALTTIGLFGAASAAECSSGCATEYGNCWSHQCRNLATGQAAADKCTEELRAGRGPIASHCDNDCALTLEMTGKAAETCPDDGGAGGNGGNSPSMCTISISGASTRNLLSSS